MTKWKHKPEQEREAPQHYVGHVPGLGRPLVMGTD